MSKTKNLLLLCVLVIFSLVFFSMIKGNKKAQIDNNIKAIKFMNIETYPYSISESLFWENGKKEFAEIYFKIGDDINSFKESIKDLKEIEEGLSENFEYAFLISNNKSVDTIYASLTENLWTIKENGEYYYYLDSNGEIKNILQEYSSFFADCW